MTKRWAFTCWRQIFILLGDEIKFFIVNHEICPTTGREHWQGYIEFYKDISRDKIKLLFNQREMHLEKAIRCKEINVIYCSKPNNLVYNGEETFKNINKQIDDMLNTNIMLETLESGEPILSEVAGALPPNI